MRTKFKFHMVALMGAMLISASVAQAQVSLTAPTPPAPPLHEQLQRQEFPTAVPVPEKHDPQRLYKEAIETIAKGHVALAGYAEPNLLDKATDYFTGSTTKKTRQQAFLDRWTKPPFELKTLDDADRAIEMALKSLGYRFDSYMVPKEVSAEDKELDNENVGIGVSVGLKGSQELVKDLPRDATEEQVKKVLIISEDHPVVFTPFKGGPADKAGMKKDDMLHEIDGKPVDGRQYHETLKDISGKKGSKVDITVRRVEDGKVVTKKLTITRDAYQVPVVHLQDLGDGVWHLKLDTFAARGAAKQVKDALDEVLSKNGKALILDLRDNGGGLLNEAIDIISYMLPEGNILSQQSRLNGGTDLFETRHHVTLDVMLQTFPQKKGILPITSQRTLVVPPEMPIVVLVNEWSASASELTSGALKFNGRAKIVGVRTLGKGVGQSLLDMPYGRRLHLTTFNFLPNNQDINWMGIGPHVEVKQGEDKSKDDQLDAGKRISLEMYEAGVKEREEKIAENERVREEKREIWKGIEARRQKAREEQEKKEKEKEQEKEKKEGENGGSSAQPNSTPAPAPTPKEEPPMPTPTPEEVPAKEPTLAPKQPNSGNPDPLIDPIPVPVPAPRPGK